MKHSRFIAVLLVGVMLCGVVQPACAWYGEEEVKKNIDRIEMPSKVVEIAKGVYDVYDTGTKLYNAKDNSERLDVVAGKAKDYTKGAVKVATNSAITSSATSTAVYLAGAAGMTAKTGTAIATLSGAAATNATLCAIGTAAASAPVVGTAVTATTTAVTAVTGVAVAPAVVGGVIVAGCAVGVCWAVNSIIDWIW